MTIEERVITCRLLEKMKFQETYSKKLGLLDLSTIHGIRLEKTVGERQGKEGDKLC